jgi:hypothetical protein
MRRLWGFICHTFKWGEHVDFGSKLLELVVDPKTLISLFGGSLAGWLASTFEHRPWSEIIIVGLSVLVLLLALLWGGAIALQFWKRSASGTGVRTRRGAASLPEQESAVERGISLILGAGAPFDQYKSRIHFREHVIRIGVENPSNKQPLTNCEVWVDQISGRLSHRCPVKVKSGFSLNPGAIEYIDFVQLDEAIKGPPLSEGPHGKEQGIIAFFPINLLSNGQSYLDDQPYTITLKATAAESAPYRIDCDLWIESGALKLVPKAQSIPAPTTRMTLAELFSTAERELGLNFGDQSLDSYVLAKALRQAGADAAIKFFGRKLPNGLRSGVTLKNAASVEVLSLIPSDHFNEYGIEYAPLLRGEDNLNTHTAPISINSPSGIPTCTPSEPALKDGFKPTLAR